MSLQEIKNLKSEKGFTIVELLIVIVVIGILAAIVIVAYVGITNTANTNKARSNATSVQKVAETMNADETGSYPTNIAAFTTGSTSTKLPTGVVVQSPGTCTACTLTQATAAAAGIPAATASNAFNTVAAYKTVASGSPTGGVIFYRTADNTIAGPIYYGAAGAGSSFVNL